MSPTGLAKFQATLLRALAVGGMLGAIMSGVGATPSRLAQAQVSVRDGNRASALLYKDDTQRRLERPARPLAACGKAAGSGSGSHAARSISTRVRVASINAPLGSVDVTVQVTAIGSKRIPAGYVAFFDSDIPSEVGFTNLGGHDAPLDAAGRAIFVLQESLPGAPFDITVPKNAVRYVPRRGSRFKASHNCPFELGMHLWPVSMSASLGRDDGNGQAVPLSVSVSSAGSTVPGGETRPAGDVEIMDAVNGASCTARLSGVFAYRGSGHTALLVDLPAGSNTLTVTYLGDAYFAPQQVTVTPSAITAAGRSSSPCPATWARPVPVPYVAPLSGSDVPMINWGFPPSTLDSNSPFCCYGKFNSTALSNPDAGTLVVQLDWSNVEPSQGSFDFGPADQEVGAAIAQGKKVALVLRFQAGYVGTGSSSTCVWGGSEEQLLPQWVGMALGSSDSFCSHGTGSHDPKVLGRSVPWSVANVRGRCRDTLRPRAGHIAYVRAPVGLGDEAKAITGPNSVPISSDLHSLDVWGYTPQLWEAWQEDMLAFYKQAFSYAPWVLYTINKQDVNNACSGSAQESIPTFPVLTIACTGRPVEVDVGEWAVDRGYGLAQNSLSWVWMLRNPAASDPPAGSVTTILGYALAHTPRPFTELQPFQALSTFCDLNIVKTLPKCVRNSEPFPTRRTTSVMRGPMASVQSSGTRPTWTTRLCNPSSTCGDRLAQIPGTDKIPTVVTVRPAQTSAARGAKLRITVEVSAPGIANFIPGGTVRVTNDLTHKLLKSVPIGPNIGTATFAVRLPKHKATHINLHASYLDRFTVHGKPAQPSCGCRACQPTFPSQ